MKDIGIFFLLFACLPLVSDVALAGTEADGDVAEERIIQEEKIEAAKKAAVEERAAKEAKIYGEKSARRAKEHGGIQAISSGGESLSVGLYSGLNFGIDHMKFTREHYKNANDKETCDQKNMGIGELFVGYNFQISKFIFGLDGGVLVEPGAVDGQEGKKFCKRKYCFGITPRIGCAISNGLSAFVNLGATFSKYEVSKTQISQDQVERKNVVLPLYSSLLLGVAVEQNIGRVFIRGSCDKVFDRTVKELGREDSRQGRAEKDVSVGAYVLKVGAGYRF